MNIVDSLTFVAVYFHFTQAHVVSGWNLNDDVSGRRQARTALYADRTTGAHGARILTTHGVVARLRVRRQRVVVCQTDGEVCHRVHYITTITHIAFWQ